jgi:hypothetical protein
MSNVEERRYTAIRPQPIASIAATQNIAFAEHESKEIRRRLPPHMSPPAFTPPPLPRHYAMADNAVRAADDMSAFSPTASHAEASPYYVGIRSRPPLSRPRLPPAWFSFTLRIFDE